MGQSANKRTLLGIYVFWDKPTPDPPLRWQKWRVQYKLALLAKENIILDTLLGPKPEMVDLPLGPIYEDTNCWFIGTIRERTKRSQRTTGDELAEQMSKAS